MPRPNRTTSNDIATSPSGSSGEAQRAPTASAEEKPSDGTAIARLNPSEEAEYDNLCGICLAEVHPKLNPRGRLNSCDHLFCAHCIKLWAKNTNVCPTCKARFTRIYSVHPDTGKEEETKVRKKNYVAWEQAYSDEDEEDEEADMAILASLQGDQDDEDDAILGLAGETARRARLSSSPQSDAVTCEVCHESHNAARIIFCDRRKCTYAAHVDCLGMAERPLTFLCPRCVALRNGGMSESVATPATPAASATTSSAKATTPVAEPQPSSRGPVSATAAPVPVRRRRNTPAETPAMPATGSPTVLPSAPVAAAASRSRCARAPPMDMGPVAPQLAPTPTPTPAAPLRRESGAESPVDLSRPTLRFPSHLALAALERPEHREVQPSSSADDDLYFLAPQKHAREAAMELQRLNQARAHESDLRRARENIKRQRLEAAVHREQRALHGSAHVGHLSPAARSSGRVFGSAEATAGSGVSLSDQRGKVLDVAEADLLNPQVRTSLEERMAREWATDLIHVLRRNQSIEENRLRLDSNGNPIIDAPLSSAQLAEKEKRLWQQAMQQARVMVCRRLDARLCEIRSRRERLVKAEAQREAAALSKLARIIASHRNAAV